MKTSINKLAVRLMFRDWRCGELRVLAAALLIAITCVTSVVFFTDRIAQALDNQASELLAADMRILSSENAIPEYQQLAEKNQLKTAQTVSFRSMVIGAKGNQLAEVKAVSPQYPLRGIVKISQDPFAAEKPATTIPATGEVWVEPRLKNQLGVSVGDTLILGAKEFQVSAYLRYEPDRSGDMFSIAPRLLINVGDLAATGLVQEGSRMRYRLLVAGDKADVGRFRSVVEKQIKKGEQIEGVRDARQEVRVALQRGEQFLGLAAIVSVVLAFIAVAMAARRYAERHLDTCAVLRCLGASHAQISRVFFLLLAIIGFVSSTLGCLLGYFAHLGLYSLADSLLLVNLPSPSFWPVLLGISVGLIGLIGFALPPVLGLRNTSTLRVIRRELAGQNPVTVTSYLFGAVALSGLALWQAGSLALGVRVLGGIAVTAAVLALIAIGLIALLKLSLPKWRVERRFAMANIVRRRNASIVQLIAFGIGLMVLLLLSIVRGDLLEMWQNSLPDDASNRFVINVQKDQLAKVEKFFRDSGLRQTRLHPMVRARLVQVNNRELVVDKLGDERAKRLATREFNLSWASEFQEDNDIVSGQWWNTDKINVSQFSVEEGIAKTLGLNLGDELTYEIAGERVSGKITSLRSVRWDTFRANFFVLAPPGLLDNYPASYITSFYLPEGSSGILDNLVRDFPNLTVIDISAVMNQVRTIISRITFTVQYVFVFTLLAGVTVMYAAIQSTLDQRVRENAILRAIGASRRRLLDGLITEFVILGVLAGILGAFCASVIGYTLATAVFELEYQFNSLVWVVGIFGGGIGIGLAGVLGTRKVLARPPLTIIRNF
jgi:putative ABC transport system permease protein